MPVAVDGVSREQVPTVDGFSTDVHAAIVQLYRHAATGELPAGPGAAPNTWLGGPGLARTPVAEAANAVIHHRRAHAGRGASPRTSRTRRPAAPRRGHAPHGRRAGARRQLVLARRHHRPRRGGGGGGPWLRRSTALRTPRAWSAGPGVHYVSAAGGWRRGDRAQRPAASRRMTSLQQALASADEAVQAGQPVQVAVVSQLRLPGPDRRRQPDRHDSRDAERPHHARRQLGAEPALAGGEIRIALPEDFRAGAAAGAPRGRAARGPSGQLAQFPRGPAPSGSGPGGGADYPR